MAKYEMSPDEDFEAFARAKGKELEEKQKKSSGTFTPTEYETIKYVAPEKGSSICVRLIGSPRILNEDRKNPWEMKTITVSRIMDDNGKEMLLYLPKVDENPDFIIWRIIKSVLKPDWTKEGDKYYPCETEHPEIYNLIKKGGFPKESSKYKFSKGWAGDERVLVNCIDRLDNWCKENKHTKLLSRSISTKEADDGKINEFPEIGINSYSFFNALQEVIAVDPNTEKFDIAIKRTGQKLAPYSIKNATKFKEANFKKELDFSESDYEKISLDERLTDEELTYERYDLDKLFPITSYTKLLKRLGKSIKKIDVELNRHFFDELTDLANKEEKERELKKEVESDLEKKEESSVESVAETVKESVTETRTRVPSSNSAKDFSTMLGGWSTLTDEEKAKIKNVTLDANGKPVIEYDAGNETIYECPNEDCQCKSPESFGHCPACGLSFN